MPTKLLVIELTEKLENVFLEEWYNSLIILVRTGQTSLGLVHIKPTQQTSVTITADQLRKEIIHQLGWELIRTCIKQNRFKKTDIKIEELEPAISIVVSISNDTQEIQSCLSSLEDLKYTKFEVIVVDCRGVGFLSNDFSGNIAIRYINAGKVGTIKARNLGIAIARFDIIAFIDGNIKVDQFWLQNISQAFEHPKVMGVSGCLLPKTIDKPIRQLLDYRYIDLQKGFRRRVFTPEIFKNKQLLWTGNFGSGQNFALRRSIFNTNEKFIGPSNTQHSNLGAYNSELFHCIATKGFTLVYDPNIVAWYNQRLNVSDIYKVLFYNSQCFGFYLIRCFMNNTVKRSNIIQFFIFDWIYKSKLKLLINRNRKIPATYIFIELLGTLSSLLFWVKNHFIRGSAHQ
jgi:hypothetical protein